MRAVANSARRVQLAGALMLGMAALAWADKVQEVGADFLEYLGSLESDDENWTEFTADAVAARQAQAAASSSSRASSSGSSSSVSRSAAMSTSSAVGKVSK